MAAARRGRIINIASISAMRGGGSVGNTLYGATKAAVVALTMGLARELGVKRHHRQCRRTGDFGHGDDPCRADR